MNRWCLVGATGAVGSEFVNICNLKKPEISKIELVSSSRSAGKEISVMGETRTVKNIEEFDFSQVDICFFSAGSHVSKDYAPKASEAGCVVIDNTSYFRMDEDKKLIIPSVNGSLIQKYEPGEIIANPNCSTIQLVKVLGPICNAFGIDYAVASTYQAASGAGAAAVDELVSENYSNLNLGKNESAYFNSPLSFNVVPVIDQVYDDGWTKEELKITQETRKILAKPNFSITSTAVRVPVVNGHCVALYLKTHQAVSVNDVIALFKENQEVDCTIGLDNVATPRFINDKTKTYVSRIRVDRDDPYGLWLWIVADNLWVGAAYNGYQIAETILEKGAF